MIIKNPVIIRRGGSGGDIRPLSVQFNGTYVPPEGTAGYAPVNVNVGSGEGNAYIHWYSPKICEGDPQVVIHSDCEMKKPIDAEDYIVTENVLSLSQKDSLNILLTLDTENIAPEDRVEFSGNSSIYLFQNGTADKLSVVVQPLLFNDLYEPLVKPPYGARNVIPRMRVIRNNVKMDSGTDTVTFTRTYPGVGIGAAPVNKVVLDGNSIMTVSGLVININQRDAAVYYVWAEEGETEDTYFLKVRWKGASHYSQAIDHEWEVVLLGNGDVILRLIAKGGYSGTYTFKGKTYQATTELPVCFYRKDLYGTSWDFLYEEYTLEHHHPEAESLYAEVRFADKADTLTEGSFFVENVGYDDNSFTLNFDSSFAWHGKTSAVVNGNSWIGLGASAENVRMHRRDSKMWYLYGYYTILTDMNDMKALRLSWRGASQYNASIDRWWTLWLFENGDAMIYIDTVGSNTGSCDFFGQAYTGVNNSFISFYYKSETGNYDIRYERYTLEHHIG